MQKPELPCEPVTSARLYTAELFKSGIIDYEQWCYSNAVLDGNKELIAITHKNICRSWKGKIKGDLAIFPDKGYRDLAWKTLFEVTGKRFVAINETTIRL